MPSSHAIASHWCAWYHLAKELASIARAPAVARHDNVVVGVVLISVQFATVCKPNRVLGHLA